ncbi:MAG: LysM peptidoglycan-binding domain-containing protein [Puniceicoccales bacterium]|nr:LysM peptidoglycan-binding domain-containing protein [Puniceicoccales bacterium]
MKSTITIAAVLLLHAAGLAALVGCRSSSGYEDSKAEEGTTSSTPSQPAVVAPNAQPVNEPAPAPLPPPEAHVTPPPASPYGPPPAPTPVRNTTEVAVGQGRSYTVKKGDSLWMIAKRERVSVDSLAANNNISKDAKLKVGSTLVIPGSGAKATTPVKVVPVDPVAPDGSVTYIVKSNDALDKIARKYHTSVDSIKAANNLTSNTIKVGQRLQIPGQSSSVSAQPAPAPGAATVVTPPPPPPPPGGTIVTPSDNGVMFPGDGGIPPIATPDSGVPVDAGASSSVSAIPVNE